MTFTELLMWLRRAPRTMRAQARYFDASHQAGKLLRRLRRTTEPAGRATILRTLAALEQNMADVFPEAFGLDPIADEGGRDMSESMTMSAALYRALAGVEQAVADGAERQLLDWGFGADADAAFSRMASTPDLADRLALLDDLYDAVNPVVGGQAAETVACLAGPYLLRTTD